MWNGKLKAVTFSIDDGCASDRRIVEIFNKYGIKGTFNINSGLLNTEYEIRNEKVEALYDKKIGARGIERAFQDVLTSINFMDISPVNYQEVIFNGACVSNPREIRLVPREKDKQLVKKINFILM